MHVAWPDGVQAYIPALLALAVSLAGGLAGRGKGRAALVPAAGAAALLAGWAALLPSWRAALGPRLATEALLAPAALGVVLLGSATWLGPTRWIAVALAGFSGWWLAAAVPVGPEFWRVWAGVAVLAFGLTRAVAGQPARALAVGLGLWGGLVGAGAGAGPIGAALVVAAAAAGLLAAGPAGVLSPVLLAVAVADTDLAAGRLLRGTLGAVDLACLGACAAPLLVAPIAARMGKRLRRAGPVLVSVLAAVLAAVVVVAVTMLLARLMRR